MSFIIKNCLQCKKDFDAPLSEHKRGKAFFCGQACYVANKTPVNLIKKCEICSREIRITHVKRISARFCSRDCYTKNQEKNKTKLCIYCGGLIPFKGNYYKRQFCCIRCSVRYRNENKK
jgi:hypothetical protein